MIKAVILAGGLGTRLRPLTNHIPKPMMPIIDKPILEYIILLLKKHGIYDIVITLGYKSDRIVEYFGNGKRLNVNITYSYEEQPLGTAGAVKSVERLLDDDFVVMSGDALTNINITELIKTHTTKGGLATLVLKEVDDITGFGVVTTDDNLGITTFEEKPSSSSSHLINTGIYAMNKCIFDTIPPHQFCDFARNVFPNILSYMYGYITCSYWSDIGTLSSYYLTNNYVVSKPALFGISL